MNLISISILGEEEVDDSIEANMSTVSPSPPSYPHESFRNTLLESNRNISPPQFVIEHTKSFDNEPLKPIREEKSQEHLDGKPMDVIDISVEEAITVEVKKSKEKSVSVSSNDTNTLESMSNGDERTPIQSPQNMSGENGRFRSVSLNDAKNIGKNEVSPRSSSFSGTSKLVVRRNQMRSDSDPGGIGTSLSSSVSSQESDSIKHENHIKSNAKHAHRKKSRSETEDGLDRDRSYSGYSDSSGTGMKLIVTKRIRGASSASLGISPKSTRGFSTTPSDYSSSLRDYGGYSAWQTLKKNRSFKKEMESTLRRASGALVPDRRKPNR